MQFQKNFLAIWYNTDQSKQWQLEIKLTQLFPVYKETWNLQTLQYLIQFDVAERCHK